MGECSVDALNHCVTDVVEQEVKAVIQSAGGSESWVQGVTNGCRGVVARDREREVFLMLSLSCAKYNQVRRWFALLIEGLGLKFLHSFLFMMSSLDVKHY